MNLYKSLLLSLVVVTTFGASVFAAGNAPAAPAAPVLPKGFFAGKRELVREYAVSGKDAVNAKWAKLKDDYNAGGRRQEIAQNPIVIAGAVTAVATIGASIWGWWTYKNKPAKPLAIGAPKADDAAPKADDVK